MKKKVIRVISMMMISLSNIIAPTKLIFDRGRFSLERVLPGSVRGKLMSSMSMFGYRTLNWSDNQAEPPLISAQITWLR